MPEPSGLALRVTLTLAGLSRTHGTGTGVTLTQAGLSRFCFSRTPRTGTGGTPVLSRSYFSQIPGPGTGVTLALAGLSRFCFSRIPGTGTVVIPTLAGLSRSRFALAPRGCPGPGPGGASQSSAEGKHHAPQDKQLGRGMSEQNRPWEASHPFPGSITAPSSCATAGNLGFGPKLPERGWR